MQVLSAHTPPTLLSSPPPLLLFSLLLSSIHPRELPLPPPSAAPLIHPLGQSPSFDGEQKQQGGGSRKPSMVGIWTEIRASNLERQDCK
ncbi:hypothetical protein Q8A67_016653 [Cirrhinus molitorella]|uniref:Uncharacterized protein n=1 Tax=Cirrhinus molitorella TaxID=172907 RepID=A0AA88PDB3_9TELE|nr:hypothetical protein Q8A67_016653 [Cirrhinus molitorella]